MTIKHINNIRTSITWNTYVSETAPLRSAELPTTTESQIKFEKRSYRYTAHITGRRALAWFEPCGRAEPRLKAGRAGVMERLVGRVATGHATWPPPAHLRAYLFRATVPVHKSQDLLWPEGAPCGYTQLCTVYLGRRALSRGNPASLRIADEICLPLSAFKT
jgi:hypothetical protein